MQRRTALSWMTGLSLVPYTTWAQATDLNDAIDKAGRQRMLSQRVAKAYLAIGLGIQTQRAQDVLNSSMAAFDRLLIEVKAYAPKDIKPTYRELESVWSDFKTVLVGQAPQRDQVPALMALDAKALALAQQGTAQLGQLSNQAVSRLVNVAGRQRMLSQRAAKYFLATAWRAKVPEAQAELNQARSEFKAALDLLEGAPEATAQIKQEIALARSQWVFFEGALAQRNPGPEHGSDVFVSSENLLSVMDKVTGLYAKLKA